MKSARIALIVLALSIVACGDGEVRPTRRASARYDGSGRLLDATLPQIERPNIVLVCLDTVRADAIEGHGDEAAAMPRLAEFCGASTRFVDASAQASWTAPCVTSMLTGLSPEHHGVHGGMTAQPLVASVATLAEYLRAAGYSTAAFTGGGWVSDEMGLAQGFESFYGTTTRQAYTLEDRGGRLASWVASHDRAKPYFLFVHTYEAHDPYGRKRPPEGFDDPAAVERVGAYARDFRSRLASPPAITMPEGVDRAELVVRWRSDPLFHEAFIASPGLRVMNNMVERYVNDEFPTDPRRPDIEARLRARYRRGLGLLDEGFAGLLARLAPTAPPATTVFILVTDHGESLGEHAYLGHGHWLTDVLTRVLLVVRAPGRLDKGVIRGSVTHADVVPTLLELCGMPAPEGIDGVSLLALARGTGRGRPIIGEEYRSYVGDERSAAQRDVSVRDERFKFVATFDRGSGSVTERLFDLVADPSELLPLGVGDLQPCGVAFVAAVGEARARVALFAKSAPPK